MRLAQDHARRGRLGEGAAERAVTFTWDSCVDEFLSAAQAAIDDRRVDERRSRLGTGLHLSSGVAASAMSVLGTSIGEVAGTSPTERDSEPPAVPGPTTGLARTVHLVKLFRKEVTDPDTFYRYLAADVVRQISRFQDPAGAVAIDVGGGPGYTSEALRAAGAHCVVADCSTEELGLHNRRPEAAIQCDARALPLRDGSMRLVCSSNMLEHVAEWEPVLSEMVRVLEPDSGLAYLTFGNWYSPWGGHETSPWHYLGGYRAAARYARRYGRRPKNEFGTSLFRLHIRDVLDWFHARGDVEIVWMAPRYWPESMRWIARVRGVREVANWNTLVMFRRRSVPPAP